MMWEGNHLTCYQQLTCLHRNARFYIAVEPLNDRLNIARNASQKLFDIDRTEQQKGLTLLLYRVYRARERWKSVTCLMKHYIFRTG